ncbi:MAG: TolC family protein [Gallionellaceae bacterium]|nr:TolC family protein [Gallionellaceae bacterium]MDD5366802.1 TolC family protein [Gallionellaceae bacterium]
MKRTLVSILALAATVAVCASAGAAGFDPFSISLKVSKTQSKSMISEDASGDPCQFGEVGSPVGLVEVVERALCHNPKTRQAWANAQVQAAVLGVRESAYLPTVNAGFAYGKQRNKTSYKDTSSYAYSGLNTDSSPTVRSGSLKMSWVLTDFGLRGSNVDQARALLDAANSTHDVALQAAFLAAAQAYFDTLTALATLDAKLEAEKAARESFMATEAKYKAGVGGLTDQLQASTAYSQAKLERVVAEGELKNAQGSLAIAMGLEVNKPLVLARPDETLPDTAFVKPIDELIDEARRYHPALMAAQSEIKAAEASVSATRAEGRPTVSLTGELSRNDQLGQPPGVGYPATDVSSTSGAIGIQVNIPLFEGFGRTYRVRTAQSQVEAKQAEYARVEQDVLLELWKSYQLLNAETEGLKTTDELVKNARKSYAVARGRYKAGVGNIVELLNVQSALAKAEQQRIQTVSNWQGARLKVATSVGRIGLWAISGLTGSPKP